MFLIEIMNPEIRQTEDGSHTLYVKELDEHYHSHYGAITESKHVFIEAGLVATKSQVINILEMGFGTGLNAFLTLIEILGTGRTVNYKGLELYPLEYNIIRSLNYSTQFSEEGRLFEILHKVPWNKTTKITDEFTLEKIHDNISNLTSENKYDLVYFDAFGPDKQPELWTTEIFIKIYNSMRYGSILTTYSSKGQVRRNLKAAGFEVEKLPGPPGKRDMTRAWKR